MAERRGKCRLGAAALHLFLFSFLFFFFFWRRPEEIERTPSTGQFHVKNLSKTTVTDWRMRAVFFQPFLYEIRTLRTKWKPGPTLLKQKKKHNKTQLLRRSLLIISLKKKIKNQSRIELTKSSTNVASTMVPKSPVEKKTNIGKYIFGTILTRILGLFSQRSTKWCVYLRSFSSERYFLVRQP